MNNLFKTIALIMKAMADEDLFYMNLDEGYILKHKHYESRVHVISTILPDYKYSKIFELINGELELLNVAFKVKYLNIQNIDNGEKRIHFIIQFKEEL